MNCCYCSKWILGIMRGALAKVKVNCICIVGVIEAIVKIDVFHVF